jgi:hypothetical protein
MLDSSALPRTAAAVLMGLALTTSGCFRDQALYGAVRPGREPVADTAGGEDADGDGFTAGDGDCDDDDADVNPDAGEIPGDGVDSNCDGEDDT